MCGDLRQSTAHLHVCDASVVVCRVLQFMLTAGWGCKSATPCRMLIMNVNTTAMNTTAMNSQGVSQIIGYIFMLCTGVSVATLSPLPHTL